MSVHHPTRREQGQATAEYALVLLVAGVIVGVFIAMVRSGAMEWVRADQLNEGDYVAVPRQVP